MRSWARLLPRIRTRCVAVSSRVILFGTQVSSRPPKFVLFTTGFLDPGYRRFIMRRLRETFDFTGTPIEISMRVRERRSLGERQSAKAKKGKGGRR